MRWASLPGGCLSAKWKAATEDARVGRGGEGEVEVVCRKADFSVGTQPPAGVIESAVACGKAVAERSSLGSEHEFATAFPRSPRCRRKEYILAEYLQDFVLYNTCNIAHANSR